jgi:hypothetical protein
MKENALAASRPGGAATSVVKHLKALNDQGGGIELHIVAHSAGAILMAPLVTALGAAGLELATCTLWAPACHMDLFQRHYQPALQARRIGRFALYVLSDKAEQDDHCARIYNKSLLYLVSNAFEHKARIPGFRGGQPLLGMEKFLGPVRPLFEGPHELVVAPDPGGLSEAREHGAFDDDRATVASTFRRILAVSGTQALREQEPAALLQFRRSASSLGERRRRIDLSTR